MDRLRLQLLGATLLGWLGLAQAVTAADGPAAKGAAPLSALVLESTATVDSRGIFLSQIATSPDRRPLPAIRLLPSPNLGAPLNLSRARLQELLAQPPFGLSVTQWSGATGVLISRRMRALEDAELIQMLGRTLQERCARDRGELELRFGRAWTSTPVPDEELTLRILDMPASGLAPLMLVRFELMAGTESAGTWQVLLQAKLWREIWVTKAPLRRGQGLAESDLGRERRDILTLRDVLAEPDQASSALQVTENVPAGAALLQRQLRAQPVVFRGQSVNANLVDGLLQLVMKVEVLEDGAPGQVIRLRNTSSRRELRGKVQHDKSIIVIM